MNYFNPYPLCLDDTFISAWKSQITEAAKTPSLAELLARRSNELFPRFAVAYSELRALPRGARRALQRRLAHSRELPAVLQDWLQQQSGRVLQQKLARTLAGAALLLILGQGASEAKDILVATNVPGVVVGDNKCSLIEAIINANNNDQSGSTDCPAGDPDLVDEDHIILPANQKIILTTPFANPGSYGPTGLPLITGAITIEGNGSTITRKKTAKHFRLLAVTSTGDLEIQGLTLSGGFSDYAGGALVNHGGLTITNSTITGNTADYGGAIANYHDATIDNSIVSKNTAKGPVTPPSTRGYGGGIANANTGTLTIFNNSTITGNKGYVGGGILNAGSISIDGSTISNNTLKGRLANRRFYGGYGAGIANGNTGSLNVSYSVITGNSALGGGAIINAGNFSISGCEISKNMALAGAGIANGGGSAPTQTIVNSTISGNIAKLKTFRAGGHIYVGGGFGGGLANLQSLITVTNSAISGNIAKGKKFRGYLLGGAGGGIWNGNTSAANLTLTGGSVSNNSATFKGGGLYNNHGTFSLSATFSGNTAKSGPDVYNAP